MFCYVELLEIIKSNDAKKKNASTANSLIIHQAN